MLRPSASTSYAWDSYQHFIFDNVDGVNLRNFGTPFSSMNRGLSEPQPEQITCLANGRPQQRIYSAVFGGFKKGQVATESNGPVAKKTSLRNRCGKHVKLSSNSYLRTGTGRIKACECFSRLRP